MVFLARHFNPFRLEIPSTLNVSSVLACLKIDFGTNVHVTVAHGYESGLDIFESLKNRHF